MHIFLPTGWGKKASHQDESPTQMPVRIRQVEQVGWVGTAAAENLRRPSRGDSGKSAPAHCG